MAKRAILASGAQERRIAFANNDRPGVMLAGAVRAYLNRWAVAAGRAVAVFANNDDAHRTARDLAAAGVRVAALIDSRTDVTRADAGSGGDFPVLAGAVVVDTRGRKGLREVIIADAGGRRTRIAADCLAVSGGWNPTLHLACHMGGRPVWRRGYRGLRAGARHGPGPDGRRRGQRRLFHAGLPCRRGRGRVPRRSPMRWVSRQRSSTCHGPRTAPLAIRALWQVPGLKGRAWLDFANDVTIKDVRARRAGKLPLRSST